MIQILAKMMELVKILGTEITRVNAQAFMVEITAKRVRPLKGTCLAVACIIYQVYHVSRKRLVFS